MGSNARIARAIETTATCHRCHRKTGGEDSGATEGLITSESKDRENNRCFFIKELFPGWAMASTLARNSSKPISLRGHF
jgi:hypothetical protein